MNDQTPQNLEPQHKKKSDWHWLTGKGNLKVWITVGIVFFVIILIVIFSEPDSNQQNEPQQQEQTQEQASEKQFDQANKEDKPAKKQKQLTTIDKLRTALNQSLGEKEGYEIKYDKGTKTATLTFTSKDFWDETALVKGAYNSLVKYGMEAFNIEGVDALTVNYKTEFTDSYGKKNMEDAVILTMPKEEFMKYDWKGLELQPISRQMEASSTYYYIHPAVKKNLKYDKLYLSL